MIPISSQSPTLPSHNSLNYELLSLTAICGEVPCACSSHLTASESYRKKVVTSLTHDKLLRIFSRQHLRGYRLGVRGKRLLLQQEPERFEFYLSGCSDTNTIKSEVSRRIRLHRIAQTYVTMLNAGALIYRDEKPPIFSPSARGPFCIEQPCFYDSREMKEAELETLKIRGSRMAGALFTSSRVFAVYNSMDFLPVFGTGTALLPWGLIKLLGGEYAFAAGLLLIYVLTQVTRQIVQPKLVGDSMGLPPLLTLFLLYLGFKADGIAGMILAVPIGLLFVNLYHYGAFKDITDSLSVLVRDIDRFRRKEE